ncbi:MAG: GTP 3',8-cyclase MoaA [Acidimicrobiales bacterium]|nr:GTP 3',8-cyclase MoaA [Acidimicrobiales bacterium]
MAERLIDTFGRAHTDLRISVTDRCNFRCAYCMPEEGMEWLDRGGILTYEEIERIAGILVREAGVTSIRLTGGEPTVRARLPLLVQRLSQLGVELSMTTNGATLPLIAADLRDAGLDRINISIDTLHRDRFYELTKRNELERVLDGITAAVHAGFDPVKLNVVPMRGINDDEILDFLQFGQDRGVTVRFIEFMPLDAQGQWSNERVVTAREILDTAASRFSFEPLTRGSSPAERFRFTDGSGEFGVIASVTEPFCEACDRMRLTADGQLRNCLFALGHTDLRSLLRSGASDDEILEAIRSEVKKKWAGHAINQVHFIRPTKSMSQLGG